MLDKNELDKYGPPGFHLSQKEKDYVQHWVLSYCSQSGFGGAFRGGTCLQKAFSLPRYSEDLDFSLAGAEEPDMGRLSAFLSSAGFSGVSWKREEIAPLSSVKLRVRGPLYNGTPVSECSVLLEFSRKGAPLLAPNPAVISPPYPDILPYQLRIMQLPELAAEKVNAILSRESARDLFDLYFILRQEKGVAMEAITKGFDFQKFRSRVRKLKSVWKREMPALTPSALSYDEAAKLVLEKMK